MLLRSVHVFGDREHLFLWVIVHHADITLFQHITDAIYIGFEAFVHLLDVLGLFFLLFDGIHHLRDVIAHAVDAVDLSLFVADRDEHRLIVEYSCSIDVDLLSFLA